MEKVRTRFAPSPTGFMHIGNLRTALYAYLYAKANGGDFILRIEDTDRERYVDGATDLVYRTLEAAGIVPDESPKNPGKYGPYVQSERKSIYRQYAETLVDLGGAYYCFCDKERLESLTDDFGCRKYDKHCLKLTKAEVAEKLKSGVPYVIRQNMPLSGAVSYNDMVFGTITVDAADMEDNILLKSDGMPTYNFANVIDDHLMNITHVIRGQEYLSSTPKYNLIYRSFGWKEPLYMHLPPIMKDEKRKLSKRYGDANFEDFISKGYLAEAIVNYIALLGWSPKNNEEKLTIQELIEKFSVDGLNKSGSIFDEAKMKWLNSLYIKELSSEKFLALASPYFDKSIIKNRYDYNKFASILQSRIDTLGEIPDKVLFIDDFKEYDIALFNHVKLKVDKNVALNAVIAAYSAVSALTAFDNASVYEALVASAEKNSIKKGQLLWSVRTAVSGLPVTPGGASEIISILGKEESLRRLAFSISLLEK